MKNGCNFVKKWHRKIFNIIDPLIGSSYHFEVLHCNYNGEIGQKWDFWLEGPIDLRPTRLNCILQDLLRDTPLDHIWRAQIRAQIFQIWQNIQNMPFMRQYRALKDAGLRHFWASGATKYFSYMGISIRQEALITKTSWSIKIRLLRQLLQQTR